MRMDGATRTLNELLAPALGALGIDDAWIVVACAAAILFLLFFILFVSRCVKINRLKAQLRDKEEQLSVLEGIARLRPIGAGQDGPGESVVYPRTGSVTGGAASMTGEVNPYAAVSAADSAGEGGSFDEAWRSENSEFLQKCETGVLSGGKQGSRHITDVIFGGTSREESPSGDDEPEIDSPAQQFTHSKGLDAKIPQL